MDEGSRDRAAGILLGLAAGDRIGGPFRLAKRLAKSLAVRRVHDRNDVARHWLEWYLSGRSGDEGATTRLVLRRVEPATPVARLAAAFEEAARAADAASGGETAGCGPLHRAMPLAMAPFLSREELAEAAISSARLTHVHPLAGEASAAAVLLARDLVDGLPWAEAVARAAVGRAPEVARVLAGAAAAGTAAAGSAPSAGGSATEVLGAALHFVGRAASFEEALAASLRFAGADNFSPVAVGALAGARWGAAAIPEGMLDHDAVRKLVPEARKIAERLAGG